MHTNFWQSPKKNLLEFNRWTEICCVNFIIYQKYFETKFTFSFTQFSANKRIIWRIEFHEEENQSKWNQNGIRLRVFRIEKICHSRENWKIYWICNAKQKAEICLIRVIMNTLCILLNYLSLGIANHKRYNVSLIIFKRTFAYRICFVIICCFIAHIVYTAVNKTTHLNWVRTFIKWHTTNRLLTRCSSNY